MSSDAPNPNIPNQYTSSGVSSGRRNNTGAAARALQNINGGQTTTTRFGNVGNIPAPPPQEGGDYSLVNATAVSARNGSGAPVPSTYASTFGANGSRGSFQRAGYYGSSSTSFDESSAGRYLNAFDNNGNGTIEDSEVVDFLQSQTNQSSYSEIYLNQLRNLNPRTDDIVEFFSEHDTDRNGFLSDEELARALLDHREERGTTGIVTNDFGGQFRSGLENSTNLTRLEWSLSQVDKNGDNVLSDEEAISILLRSNDPSERAIALSHVDGEKFQQFLSRLDLNSDGSVGYDELRNNPANGYQDGIDYGIVEQLGYGYYNFTNEELDFLDIVLREVTGYGEDDDSTTANAFLNVRQNNASSSGYRTYLDDLNERGKLDFLAAAFPDGDHSELNTVVFSRVIAGVEGSDVFQDLGVETTSEQRDLIFESIQNLRQEIEGNNYLPSINVVQQYLTGHDELGNTDSYDSAAVRAELEAYFVLDTLSNLMTLSSDGDIGHNVYGRTRGELFESLSSVYDYDPENPSNLVNNVISDLNDNNYNFLNLTDEGTVDTNDPKYNQLLTRQDLDSITEAFARETGIQNKHSFHANETLHREAHQLVQDTMRYYRAGLLTHVDKPYSEFFQELADVYGERYSRSTGEAYTANNSFIYSDALTRAVSEHLVIGPNGEAPTINYEILSTMNQAFIDLFEGFDENPYLETKGRNDQSLNFIQQTYHELIVGAPSHDDLSSASKMSDFFNALETQLNEIEDDGDTYGVSVYVADLRDSISAFRDDDLTNMDLNRENLDDVLRHFSRIQKLDAEGEAVRDDRNRVVYEYANRFNVSNDIITSAKFNLVVDLVEEYREDLEEGVNRAGREGEQNRLTRLMNDISGIFREEFTTASSDDDVYSGFTQILYNDLVGHLNEGQAQGGFDERDLPANLFVSNSILNRIESSAQAFVDAFSS